MTGIILDLDLNLQAHGELRYHLMCRMNRLWHWNLKREVLITLRELWFIVKNFLSKVICVTAIKNFKIKLAWYVDIELVFYVMKEYRL